MDIPKVLSIQSHVVSGYVGNKSATFPLQVSTISSLNHPTTYTLLQLLGIEVDPLNSVQFSNHTGYKHFAGSILTDKDLDQLVTNLALNGLDFYTHVLTGYVGSVTFLQRIAAVVQHQREINPNLTYGS